MPCATVLYDQEQEWPTVLVVVLVLLFVRRMKGESVQCGAKTPSEGATKDLVAGELLGVVGEEVAVFVLYPI